MTTHYEFDIEHATKAPDLHALSNDIAEDGNLSPEERAALDQKISERFCQLNSRPAGEAKPRW